jgi:hypothetical protein
MKYLRVEMKICEGCGALWLRRGVSDGVYCSDCAVRVAGFPPVIAKRAGGRPTTGRPRRRPRLIGCSVGRHRSGGAK